MASSTANLGLRKPAVSENWSVQDDFNANMQKIDDKFGAVNGTVKENLDALNGKLAAIGTVVGGNPVYDQAINAGNGTKYANNSITLTAGTWLICGFASINKAVAGTRQGLTITTNNADLQFNRELYALAYQPSANNENQYYNVSGIVTPTGTTTYYAMIFNGDVSANVTTGLKAIRIK